MDTVSRNLFMSGEDAKRRIQENDRRLAAKEEDFEVLDSDIVTRETPTFAEVREKQIQNSNKEIERKYTMSKEEAEIEKNNDITAELEKSIEKYLDDNPKFATRMARKFMHIIQKEDDLEINVRKPIYKRITPYLVLATMALSSIFTSKIKDQQFEKETVAFSSEVEDIFSSVDQAPIPVMDSYVDATTMAYYESTDENKSLRNDKFEDAYRRFYSELAKEEPDLYVLRESAKAVSNIAATDGINETLPFEATNFKGSIVKDGKAFIPVTDESQVKDGEELIVQNGTLYKKGR